MPHTHPQYRLAVEYPGAPLHMSCDCVARSLDEALAHAARAHVEMLHWGWDDQRYYVEPVPGTEPRYLLVCDHDGARELVSTLHHQHNGGKPLTWREGVALYQERLAGTGNPHHWYGLVAA